MSARRASVSSVVVIRLSLYEEAFMRSGFSGFPQEGVDFMRTLARRNRREWFQPRKAVFEERVKQPMTEMVEALNRAMTGFAPEYVTDPKVAIFRIYSDTRFSA